jgi:hypothetical protein
LSPAERKTSKTKGAQRLEGYKVITASEFFIVGRENRRKS